MDYIMHIGNITVGNSNMLRYDIALEGGTPKNSLIKGHVYDQVTSNPLKGVKIKFTDDKFYNKKKKTDASGYYELAMRPMTISIICEYNGYKRYVNQVTIAEYETLTIDIYLEPIPKREAIVFGYIYDNGTGSPLIGKKIYTENKYETNRTKTNVHGYYSFNVVPGNVTVYIDLNNYEYHEIDLVLAEDENYQLDIYLNKV